MNKNIDTFVQGLGQLIGVSDPSELEAFFSGQHGDKDMDDVKKTVASVYKLMSIVFTKQDMGQEPSNMQGLQGFKVLKDAKVLQEGKDHPESVDYKVHKDPVEYKEYRGNQVFKESKEFKGNQVSRVLQDHPEYVVMKVPVDQREILEILFSIKEPSTIILDKTIKSICIDKNQSLF